MTARRWVNLIEKCSNGRRISIAICGAARQKYTATRVLTDLIAGHIQMAIETSGSALQHIKAGAVRALAVSTREPSPFFPGLPTLDEAGLKGYDVTT